MIFFWVLEWNSHAGESFNLVHDLFLGVGVELPCTVMECGDIIYRSTLPKSSGIAITAHGVILALGTHSYLWATPGLAPGFFDMFFLAHVERIFRLTYKKDDIVLGKKLGEGSFGAVYKALLAIRSPKYNDAVLKKPTEYGAVEIWMNERVQRSSPKRGAEYWLLEKFEGEATLADLMQSKEFPYYIRCTRTIYYEHPNPLSSITTCRHCTFPLSVAVEFTRQIRHLQRWFDIPTNGVPSIAEQ